MTPLISTFIVCCSSIPTALDYILHAILFLWETHLNLAPHINLFLNFLSSIVNYYFLFFPLLWEGVSNVFFWKVKGNWTLESSEKWERFEKNVDKLRLFTGRNEKFKFAVLILEYFFPKSHHCFLEVRLLLIRTYCVYVGPNLVASISWSMSSELFSQLK